MKALIVLALVCAVAVPVFGAAPGDTLYTSTFDKTALKEGQHTFAVESITAEEGLPTPTLLCEVVEGGDHGLVLTGCSVKFTGENLPPLPAVQCILKDAEGLQDSPLVRRARWDAALVIHDVTFPLRLPVKDLPAKLRLSIIKVESRRTTYSYTLRGLSTMAPNMYDLVPANTTMSTLFIVKWENNRLGWWVRRKPPMPPFSAFATRNGKLVFQHYVPEAPPSGSGFADVFGTEVGKDKDEEIVLTAVFSEQHRDIVAKTSVPSVPALLKELQASGDKTKIVETSHKGFRLRWEYFDVSKSIGVGLLQPNPITGVAFVAKYANGTTIFFEEENHVVYVDPAKKKQFGWPAIFHERDLQDTKSPAVEIEVHFDNREEMTTPALVTSWLQDSKAVVWNLAVHKAHEGQGVFLRTYDVKEHQYIATVPFSSVLGTTTTDRNPYIKALLESPGMQTLAKESGMTSEDAGFMQLTFFALVQGGSPYDGSNWKVYFESLPKTAPLTPLTYTADELKAFDFINLGHVVAQLKKKVDLQYAAIVKMYPWFEDTFPKRDYENMHAIVCSRALSFGTVQMMVPLVDFFNHRDLPNAKVGFDQENHTVVVQSLRDIAVGDEITIDYSAMDYKTKLEFFVRYGFVPANAKDSAVVDGVGITMDEASLTPLLHRGESSKAELLQKLTTLMKRDKPTFDGLSGPKLAAAKALYASHDKVLSHHVNHLTNQLSQSE